MDSTQYIGQSIRNIMELMATIDAFMPEEDGIEVLIGAMTAWGAVESELLYSTLEAAFEGAETITTPARERLNKLHDLQQAIHDGEGADAPFTELAKKYRDGIAYHLAADVQHVLPLVTQLPDNVSRELAQSMDALKQDLA